MRAQIYVAANKCESQVVRCCMRMTTTGGTHISADSMLLASVRVARPKNPCVGGKTDRSLITYCGPRSETLLRCWTNADSHTKTAATITETASIEVVSAKGSWPGIVERPYGFRSLRRPRHREKSAQGHRVPELDRVDHLVHNVRVKMDCQVHFGGME